MKKRSIDFSKFSSIKIGPVVDVTVIEKGDVLPKDHLLIGHANNLLISPMPPKLMMLGKDFDYIKIEDERLIIGAATPTGKILSFCKKFDIGGFEYVAKLPGTLGGMLAMNAGVKSYETFNTLLEVKTDIGTFAKEEIEHGYRYANLPGIALEGTFKFEKGFNKNLAEQLLQLRTNQPQLPSAGSAFKNPPGDYAGRLIEAVGLKGERIGNMAWSDMHANFLVNLGGGIFDDAITLIELAKKRVFDMFNIELEIEIKII
ncbi:UDP-N-acetylmuramate dehydrogenase [Hydrogenimonas thermophila]|uniref:UDP-N-acetylenolpyruvoylglucosamine reductase n=1 Tax=Hydrogenimonas thermophila TaxID=223786 RepID=A0A1I5L603_9BACT|nr:UDP-N-acetylmuramate dehydrogenase [Hydrogenimonas thermophila]SFO92749.1 UDP-N-acetylmuramate dehydrogenase [Hydrogenimonas thermophila]